MNPRISDLTAIFFAITGFTCWVLGDSCVKWVGQFGLPPDEVVAFMGFFMALVLAIQAFARGHGDNLRPRSIPRQFVRALLDMSNNICVVIALRHLSLTMFYILVFTSPLTIALLSAIFLREHITRRKTLALVLGFCGVVIAVAPWSHTQHVDLIGVASCMVCVACFSVNMVWSRVLTRTEPPESLAFCSGVVTALAGFALCSFHAKPLTPTLWLTLMMMGFFCAAGTLCFYIAVKHTSASNVSQYHYTQLLTGTLVSYAVWRDKPGLPMLLGGGLILGSGLLIALAARKQTMPAPLSV
ncbi:DMT family transporter [Telmatobacter bradus]|uniref:DMT family transporter n=1 Tax=Telmatobacter bradus TaxID=474953 RepID=UPI003B43B7B0